IPMAGCGMVEIDFGAPSGSIAFGGAGTYTAAFSLGDGTATPIPAACKGVKSCVSLDSPLLSCSGDPAAGCACKGVPVDEMGTYKESAGVLVLTPSGPGVLKTVGGWCAEGASLELLVADSVVLGASKE